MCSISQHFREPERQPGLLFQVSVHWLLLRRVETGEAGKAVKVVSHVRIAVIARMRAAVLPPGVGFDSFQETVNRPLPFPAATAGP